MKINIVDRNNNLIGYKERSEVNYTEDIIQSAVLWIYNSNDEILIAQRKLTKDKDPGKWGPAVAGTVDSGEDYEKTVYRESEEEIGLSGEKFEMGPRHFLQRGGGGQWYQWYTLKLDRKIDEFKIQENEVEKIEWISSDELYDGIKKNQDKYVPALVAIVDDLIKNMNNTQPNH